MVGFFFADVVSARDLRDFLLPEFESMRIAQWAVRAEYFGGDTHFEMLWVPKPSYDEIGKPGGDFYAFPWIPAGTAVDERKPDNDDLGDGNWGLRVSHLVDGWDLSAFYYRSHDISPTVEALQPGLASMRHDRLHQVGGTFSKDLGRFVLKGEAVHTRGRSLNTFTPAGVPGGVAVGLAPTDMVDYALGVDVPVGDWRFNAQYYGRWLDDHHPAMASDRSETGLTFQAVRSFGSDVEVEMLAVTSLNRSDYMLRPKLTWKFAPAWRMVTGLDVFGGDDAGLFGSYDRSDRAYVELRHVVLSVEPASVPAPTRGGAGGYSAGGLQILEQLLHVVARRQQPRCATAAAILRLFAAGHGVLELVLRQMQQHGRRAHTRADQARSCEAVAENALVEACMTWVHLDEHVAHALGQPGKRIQRLQQAGECVLRAELGIDRELCNFAHSPAFRPDRIDLLAV